MTSDCQEPRSPRIWGLRAGARVGSLSPMTTDNKTAAPHVPGTTTDQSPVHRPAGTEERMGGQVDPSEIMQLGMGLWASKTLLPQSSSSCSPGWAATR